MNTPSEPGPSAGGAKQVAGKRRRSNVNKACENCRRRRVKCDGVRPSCGTCGVYKDDCMWDPREDFRKPLSRRQAQALVMRVEDLERLLKQHGVDPGRPTAEQGLMKEEVVEKEEYSDETPGTDLRDYSMDHLVEGEAGDLHLHGPTSAFRHLGKLTPERSGGLNLYKAPEINHDLHPGYARHLPPNVYLSEEEHDRCLDRFFKYYACWGLRSNPILFEHDKNISLQPPFPRTPHYSPLLHNAMLAISLGFSNEPRLRLPSTRKIFADRAKSFIDDEGMTPSVATVQALAHLASYHSLAAEHNLGWLYIGMALRCAVALGLNTDVTRLLDKGQITEEQARERNVTFWTTFIQEGLWAPYIGRSISIPEHTTPLPTIDDSLDQRPWENEVVPGVEPIIKPQPSLLSTTFLQTVKLMQIGERIMNTLYGIKVDLPTLDKTGVISDISLALGDWLENLPPSLVVNYHSPKNCMPHVLMMHLSHAWLVILLHRPFYRPLAGLPSGSTAKDTNPATSKAAWAVKQCDKAAIHVIHLLQTWHRVHNLRFSPPTALQVCFIAGTTHLLSLASARSSSKRQEEAMARVDECIHLMKLIAMSWPAAEQGRRLLEGLKAEYGFSPTVKPELSSSASTHSGYESLPPPQPQGPSTTQVPYYGAGMGTNVPWSSADSNTNMTEFFPTGNDGTVPQHFEPTMADHFAVFSPFQELNAWSAAQPDDNWQQPNFDMAPGQVDAETQALLDTILQPHLNIDVGHDNDRMFPYPGI